MWLPARRTLCLGSRLPGLAPGSPSTSAFVETNALCRHSFDEGIGPEVILRGVDSASICAAFEELGEYPACPNRSHIVKGSAPRSLIVQPDKNWRYFYYAFKQQQHQRKQPGGKDIHNP